MNLAGVACPRRFPSEALNIRLKGGVRENTTIALVATDATLTKAQAHRLAMVAHDGLARAIYPVHTPLDGDTVFAASTGKRPLTDPIYALSQSLVRLPPICCRARLRAPSMTQRHCPSPARCRAWKDKFGA